jgi:hypothetical protein
MDELRLIYQAILVTLDPTATPGAKGRRWRRLSAEGRRELAFMTGETMTPGTALYDAACALRADVAAMMVERRAVTKRRACVALRRAHNDEFIRAIGRWINWRMGGHEREEAGSHTPGTSRACPFGHRKRRGTRRRRR